MKLSRPCVNAGMRRSKASLDAAVSTAKSVFATSLVSREEEEEKEEEADSVEEEAICVCVCVCVSASASFPIKRHPLT